MDSRAIEAYLKRLKEIIDDIVLIAPNTNMHEWLGHQIEWIGESGALVDGNITKYEKLLELLWKSLRCEDRFTKEGVDILLKQLIMRIIHKGDQAKIQEYFTDFVDRIENYAVEQIIYIALDNIEMYNVDKLEIGRVTLRKMTDRQINFVARLTKKVAMQTTHPPEHKPLIIDTLLKQNVEPLRGKICAEFRFVAEPNLAEDRALEETFRAIDLLRYAIPFVYSMNYPSLWYPPSIREKERKNLKKSEYRMRHRNGVGLEGEVGKGRLNKVILSTNAEHFTFRSHLSGMQPFVISPETIATMKAIGVFKVAKLLKKYRDEITPFQDVLLSSIHWFANAQIQFELENELLNLVTSLETILADPTENLMDSVGYGIAFLLGTNLEQRLDLIARYKDIYGKRSKTTHHGQITADELDLMELRDIAIKVTQIAIKNMYKWKDPKQLLDWVKKRKLM